MVKSLFAKPPVLFTSGGALAMTVAPASMSAVRVAPVPYCVSPIAVMSALSACSSGSNATAISPSGTFAGATFTSVMISVFGSTAT
jgi:hypothetical protein